MKKPKLLLAAVVLLIAAAGVAGVRPAPAQGSGEGAALAVPKQGS